MEALAKHCTAAEDAAKEVERQVIKSAAAILLEARIGEQFDAIVTGATNRGTWVRLLHPPIEGRLESGFEGMDVATGSASNWSARMWSADISTLREWRKVRWIAE